MSTPYLGEIRAVGFTYAPPGWSTCNGQTLSINDNQTLYALIGTTYGGDGNTTFNLPNLSGRVSPGTQGGPGLSNYVLGAIGGAENVTLNASQLSTHGHPFTVPLGASTTGNVGDDPANRLPGTAGSTYLNAPQSGKTLAPTAVTGSTGAAGGNQPHPNIQPVLALNYIICIDGFYPPRQ